MDVFRCASINSGRLLEGRTDHFEKFAGLSMKEISKAKRNITPIELEVIYRKHRRLRTFNQLPLEFGYRTRGIDKET